MQLSLKKLSIHTSVALAISSCFNPVIAAEEVSGAETNKEERETRAAALQSVVVTAQKREESVQEVPLTVNAIDGNTLLDANAGLTAGEITRFIPNASAATLDNHGFPRWFLRGIGTGQPSLDNVSPIGYYVDEVYLGPILMSGGPLFDIERVEVLPGPQGTLWGKNSPGGAVSVVSRKPQFDNNGWVKATIGSYNQQLVQGAINAQLVEDKLATRISFSSENRDQWVKNIAKGKRGELEDQAIRWQLLGQLSENLEALLSVHYRKYTQDEQTSYITFGPPGSVDARGNPYPQFPSRVYSFNAPSDTTHEQSGAVLTLNWDWAGYILTSITGFEKVRNVVVSDGDNSPQEISRSYNSQEAKQFSQEFRLASPRQDRFNWITGVHYYKSDLNAFSASGSPQNSSTAYNNNGWSGDTSSLGIFASATYNFTDKFTLTGGLRWNEESKDINLSRQRATGTVTYNNGNHWWNAASVNNALATYVNYDNDRTWREVTWDVTPEYKLNDNIRSYLRIAKGFRGGGYITSPGSQAATGTFDPEFIVSYEAGVKSEWLDGRLLVNGAAFLYDYDDIQINIYRWDPALNLGVSRMQNAGSAKVKGVEFDIQALPTDNLQLRFSLGLLNTEYKDYRDDNGNDYSGNSFARAPSASAVFAGSYKIPLPKGKLVIGGDINTRSSFHFNATDPDNPAQKHSGYTLVNLRASYIFPDERIKLTAYVDNATDKDYWQATSPVGPNIVGLALGAPRTVGASLQYDW